ncbi:MAG: DNA polymerase IV [Candidatus Omnitrophota bacterium]|nr:DNA polymerase IV [Candidatus Omnitrophota bacterium]
MSSERYIVHVDMDAFFAAVEQRDNPNLCGKPVVIGADPKGGSGRGVVSTCSYEARKFGIRSAMPISVAYRKCPHAVYLPPDMNKYLYVSREIFNILYGFTPWIEPISIDEAFLDITGSVHLFGTAPEIGLLIKSKIKKETGLTASVGLAPIMMAAKIASDLEKPDGFVVVTAKDLLNFLWPLDVSKIWGLGNKSVALLRSLGVNTIGDLARSPQEHIFQFLGNMGLRFWQLSNGIDDRSVSPLQKSKSISHELTFEEDVSSKEKIESSLMVLCEKVSGRMRQAGVKAKTIGLKIRLDDFKTYTRAITLSRPTNFVSIIFKIISELFNEFDTRNKRVRLIGVKGCNFSGNCFQRTLFYDKIDEKQNQIHNAIDKIKNKFGQDSICRASGGIKKYFRLKKV